MGLMFFLIRYRSALTNDAFKLARFAGFYKAIQSAGAAGSFGMDAVNTPFLNELVRARYFEYI